MKHQAVNALSRRPITVTNRTTLDEEVQVLTINSITFKVVYNDGVEQGEEDT